MTTIPTYEPKGEYEIVRYTVFFRCDPPWPEVGEYVRLRLSRTYALLGRIVEVDSDGLLTFAYQAREWKDKPYMPVRDLQGSAGEEITEY